MIYLNKDTDDKRPFSGLLPRSRRRIVARIIAVAILLFAIATILSATL